MKFTTAPLANLERWKLPTHIVVWLLFCSVLIPVTSSARTVVGPVPSGQFGEAEPQDPRTRPPQTDLETTQDRNQHSRELIRQAELVPIPALQEYRIGPEDVLRVTVFEAPALNRSLRVSATGEISMPLLGTVKAAGLTPRELELVLQELLRRTYMKDPHVGIFVSEMQSHPVSVFGAVERPGVFQLRRTRTLLEVLSMAGGLADDARDTVIVMRGASFRWTLDQSHSNQEGNAASSSPAGETGGGSAVPSPAGEPSGRDTVEIDLGAFLESGDPRYNVPIYAGDIVYVMGSRRRHVYLYGLPGVKERRRRE